MKILISIIYGFLLFTANVAKAERVPVKMHRVLFGCSVIAKSKIVKHSDHSYTIQIVDVYYDRQTGIKAGDYIQIEKEMNVIYSSETVHRQNVLDRRTGVAFLYKSDKGWGVVEFPFFEENRVILNFYPESCRVQGTSDEIKAQIQEYFTEFRMENQKLIAPKTEKEVINSDLGQLSLIQYYQIYRFSVSSKIRDLSLIHI